MIIQRYKTSKNKGGTTVSRKPGTVSTSHPPKPIAITDANAAQADQIRHTSAAQSQRIEGGFCLLIPKASPPSARPAISKKAKDRPIVEAYLWFALRSIRESASDVWIAPKAGVLTPANNSSYRTERERE
jgi:hypothetical protein